MIKTFAPKISSVEILPHFTQTKNPLEKLPLSISAEFR